MFKMQSFFVHNKRKQLDNLEFVYAQTKRLKAEGKQVLLLLLAYSRECTANMDLVVDMV